MSVFKWSLSHKAERSAIVELVESFDFEPMEDRDGMYVHVVKHREIKVKLRPDETVFYLFKEEDSTTEVYFEYLFRVGYIVGQIASKIERLPARDDTEDEDE